MGVDEYIKPKGEKMPTQDLVIPVDRAHLEAIERALQWAERYFRHRDKMNAAVHCERPRESPITVSVSDARSLANRILHPQPHEEIAEAAPEIIDRAIAEGLIDRGPILRAIPGPKDE